ncbi:monovalent cation:proton antiporter-2 (CPA2) family protein [Catenovulum sp. 2E275]|uniref:monovalent cation:proton antiporter family protein n=1 Tax=Catenovulum sp. 2E275 TaxID=2980497 RepID=UPI0021D381F1|nr:monovalent cation:proton antiporter family protein [Catenovulum sp. 2E275]MCU4676077.1 monovalent cation:proton antiporter-2 (CPA2) family protein [Catenovulum sp. 2E275]
MSAFSEVLFLLAIAVASVALFRRLNLAPVLAYLFAGILAGPSIFDLFSGSHQINFIAELGIVFLLFSLGLEFSFPRLIAMRNMVFGIGLAQVLVTLLVGFIALYIVGMSWQAAFVMSCAFALSSTAIVIKQLSENGKLQTYKGQLSVSVLLFQDLAVVPMLIVLPIIAGAGEGGIGIGLWFALLKGLVVFVLIMATGKWVLPKLFNEIARSKSDEIFVLTTILVALLAGAVTHLFGLSMALGAFLAGMMLGESQYKHQLEADIRPFKDVLMGLFFVSVGMQFDLFSLMDIWYWLLLAVAAVMLIKVVIIQLIIRSFNYKKSDAWATGLMLSQVGEFGFVIAALALEHSLIGSDVAAIIIGVGVISMGITPFLIAHAEHLGFWLSGKNSPQLEPTDNPQIKDLQNHVVICGFGRVGQTVSRFLKMESIPFIALDVDPTRVKEASAASEPVLFGDARKLAILKSTNIEKAQLVIIAFDDLPRAISIIRLVKQHAPQAKVLVRTHADDYLQELTEAGADEVIPETLEGSLMLVSHVLFHSGVPVKRIFGRVRRERKNHYHGLHGFFRGDSSKTGNDEIEYLHAVTLVEGAFAIGYQLSELDLPLEQVEVSSIRRNEQDYINPDPSVELKAGDILVLLGSPHKVEKAEIYLLEGR